MTRTYTHAQRRQLSREADLVSSRYPRHMVPFSPVEMEQARLRQAERNQRSTAPLVNAWRSRTHIAQLYGEATHLRLSVQRVTDQPWHIRYDRAGGISWDDLQRIKAECGFADCWALEVYPPDAEVIDVAPMRHLWLQGERPSFAWRSRTGASA